MPLVRIDIYEGRTAHEIKLLLDVAHRVTVEVFHVPTRDRFQVINEHPETHMIIEDTGLNIPRTKNCVLFQITTRTRSRDMKKKFYQRLTEDLEKHCGILKSDVIMNFVTCTDEDWSFGYGHAQFLTSELASS